MESLNLKDNLRALPERVGGRFGMTWGTFAEVSCRVDLGCLGNLGGGGSEGGGGQGTCRLSESIKGISMSSG